MSAAEEDASSPEVTLAFYRRLYPFKQVYNWLNQDHASSRLITNREFALTLQGDVYLRYNSFATAEEMKKEICRYNPTRFEIGPIYSARVSFGKPERNILARLTLSLFKATGQEVSTTRSIYCYSS